jgi:hypothetical protein
VFLRNLKKLVPEMRILRILERVYEFFSPYNVWSLM